MIGQFAVQCNLGRKTEPRPQGRGYALSSQFTDLLVCTNTYPQIPTHTRTQFCSRRACLDGA